MKIRRAPWMLALLLSLAAHALTLGGSWLKLPQQAPAPSALTATLKPMQPAPSAPAAAQPRPVAKRTPTRVAAAPATILPDFAVPPMVSEPQAEAPNEPAAGAPAAPEHNPIVNEKPPEQEPVVVATAAPTTLAAEAATSTLPQAIRALPRKGRIAYNLNYFVNGAPLQVGRTVQSWELSGNQYRLDSRSETSGLARLTRFGPRVFSSIGEITGHGLQPREFTSSVTTSGNVDNSAARFDWNARQLQFGRPIDQKSAALPLGAQDFVSFMYQLSLAPMSGNRIQIPLTNGVRFDTLEFDVRPEEHLDTPLGMLRVMPVAQVRKPNTETMEVWLAAEYNYLPVRIRFIGRDGAPTGEQIVTDIRVGNE